MMAAATVLCCTLTVSTMPATAQTVQDGTEIGNEAAYATLVAELQNQLSDPFSAVLRGLRFLPGLVCGEINAKNQFGAYTGFTEFYFDAAARLPGRRLAMASEGGLAGLAIVRGRCNSAGG